MTILYNKKESKTTRSILRKQQTPAENKLWSYLRRKQLLGLKFYRQYSVGRYVVDFYCPKHKLAIEIDGGQHNNLNSKIYDFQRTQYLKSVTIKVVRYWNNDVLTKIDEVLDDIYNHLNSSQPPL